MKQETFTVRLPLQDSAALEILIGKLKLREGAAISKAEIIRQLVAGFLAGRFQLPVFANIDVVAEIEAERG